MDLFSYWHSQFELCKKNRQLAWLPVIKIHLIPNFFALDLGVVHPSRYPNKTITWRVGGGGGWWVGPYSCPDRKSALDPHNFYEDPACHFDYGCGSGSGSYLSPWCDFGSKSRSSLSLWCVSGSGSSLSIWCGSLLIQIRIRIHNTAVGRLNSLVQRARKKSSKCRKNVNHSTKYLHVHCK